MLLDSSLLSNVFESFRSTPKMLRLGKVKLTNSSIGTTSPS